MKYISLLTSLFSLLLATAAVSHVISDRDQPIFDRLSQSVVKVVDGTVPPIRGGTGFVMRAPSGKPIVMTNNHVCEGMANPLVIRDNEFKLNPKILKKSPQVDLCAIEGVPGVVLDLAEKNAKKFGRLLALGHPFLGNDYASAGLFLGFDSFPFPADQLETGLCPSGSEMKIIQGVPFCAYMVKVGDSTITAYPGSSGSPVVDYKGELVGVINSINGVNQASFIPLDSIREFINGL